MPNKLQFTRSDGVRYTFQPAARRERSAPYRVERSYSWHKTLAFLQAQTSRQLAQVNR